MNLAIIGGSGIYDFGDELEVLDVQTGYGVVPVKRVETLGNTAFFICRHGSSHSVPPHQINYRANISALKSLGVDMIIATNAVGGIADDTPPGTLVLPDQLIDYTWGREHTFFDSFSDNLNHIDFTEPFSNRARALLIESLIELKESFVNQGVYGCVQGPRLETAAEVKKYKRDGCTVLGMTGMPEASLAREAELAYASICFSVNWAAGLHGVVDIEDVFAQVESCSLRLKRVLAKAISLAA